MSNETALPPSLLSRLLSDAPVNAAPSSADLLRPLDPTDPRTDASSRLLSLTPLALEALATSALSIDPKVRLNAATKILEYSPATKQSQAPTLTISPDALASILTPIASLLTSLATSASLTSASDTSPILATPAILKSTSVSEANVIDTPAPMQPEGTDP